MQVDGGRARCGDGLDERRGICQHVDVDGRELCLVDELLLGGVELAHAGEDDALCGHGAAAGEGQIVEHRAQRHARERAGRRAAGSVEVAVRVEPDDGERLVMGCRVRDRGHGHAAVAADHDRMVIGAVRRDACLQGIRQRIAHAGEGAEATDARVERFTRLHGNVDADRRGAREVSRDRLGAVDQVHRPRGGGSLPLRHHEKARHGSFSHRAARRVSSRALRALRGGATRGASRRRVSSRARRALAQRPGGEETPGR